jgi:hypothetical protein
MWAMPSSRSVANNSAATTGFFNSRFPQFVIPNGPFSDATEKARSIATAISQATTSGVSYVYVPRQYLPYRASLISSLLTTTGVWLMVEGKGDALNVEAYGADYTNDESWATENVIALQTAVHSARTGMKTALPDGCMALNSTVTMPVRRRLDGSGPDSFLRFIQTDGKDGLVIGDGVVTCDGWFINGFGLSSESGGGSPLRFNCAHRGTAVNINIPSTGSAGVHVAGGLLNTFNGVNVSVNHPYPYGSRSSGSIGFKIENGLIGTCAGNGANGNTFIGCNAEGIKDAHGIGFDVHSDGNAFIGGSSEGNNIGVRLGVGVHNNSFRNVYFEVNSSSNVSSVVTSANTQWGRNSFDHCVGVADGDVVSDRLLAGNGVLAAPGIGFRDATANGFLGISVNGFAAVVNGARTWEYGTAANYSYKTLEPDSSVGSTAGIGHASFPFGTTRLQGTWDKPLYLNGYALWVNASSGKLYKKSSAPANDTDGVVIGTES